MTMTRLIGLLGPAGVGKDTFADHLVSKHDFVKMSLADEMKRICKRVYDFSDEQLWGPSAMRNGPDRRYLYRIDGNTLEPIYLSPRVALQTLGTEFGRACFGNTWVNLTIRDAKQVMDGKADYSQTYGLDTVRPRRSLYPVPGRSVVVPDCRFMNEVQAIHEAGGIVIRLKRKTAVDATTVGIVGHASETEQLSIPDGCFDHVVEVPDGIPAYHEVIDTLIKES